MLRAQVAALLAVALPLAAFTVDAVRPAPASFGVEGPMELIDVVPPPPTRHETAKPPPPPRPPVLIEVPDDVFLDDVPIDFSEEEPVTVPLPPLPIEPDLPEVEDPEVFVIVEQPPVLQPNAEAGMRALQQCIRYPEMAKRAGIEGRVFVQFVVDENGRVTAPVVARGIGGGADEEALRCVREATFTPGLQRDKAVKVKFSLPVTFRLR